MTDNVLPERSAETRLRVAVVADGDRLAALVAVLRATPLVDVLVQSGMPSTAALPGIERLDDPRFVLARPELQAVLLGRSTRADVEFAALAGEKGLHVWLLPPLGRSFAEAAEAARLAKRHNVILRIASWWEHVAEHAWADLNWPGEFKPLLSELYIRGPGPAVQAWRSRSAEASGGVLASEGYGGLEALTAMRGLPDAIAAATGQFRRAAGEVKRETEDTALALLRYTSGGAALLRAAWDHAPAEFRLEHHSATSSVALAPDEIVLSDPAGQVLDRRPFPADWLADDLHRFSDWVRGDARDRAAAALERHLAVTAVLETTYLAAQTGDPESPAKLYKVQGWPLPRT